jgi:A/G-specific adenine glycosylase
MTSQDSFQKTVWQHYRQHGRHDLPWRLPIDDAFDPYRILVSEIMLQQTQVHRVLPKYMAFLETYPNFRTLATAPLSAVIAQWNGLGYNRRAKFLWQTARAVQQQHGGKLPATLSELVRLPGIGTNTAGAILAYAFNQPIVFIETNIRTVFIHHFFAHQTDVDDKALLPVIEETLPKDNPREWYWALMDYGTYLKQTVGNVSRASKSYAKQSTFEGSRRQIRGQVLRELLDGPRSLTDLSAAIADERLASVLEDLNKEGMIAVFDAAYQLRA